VVLHASTHLKADTHAAQLCAQCLSSAPLHNMAGGGASIVAHAQVDRAQSIQCDTPSRAPQRAFTGFRSRAPPALS
jgi:hypothetical protein